ncbi:MAG: DNA translocase FtsK [Succiniclasticum sp.]
MFDSEERRQYRTIEQTLEDFCINARVIGITRGSSITHFKLGPALSISEANIHNLAKSLGVAVL